MSVERHPDHESRHERIHEELDAARQEKLAELHQNKEHLKDDAQERAEAAREVIHSNEKQPEHHKAPEEPRPENHAPKPFIPMLNPRLNYAQTMQSIQNRLSPVSRSFSKIIHTPIVEKTSEVLERTVARPSLMVGSSWTALLVGLAFYLTARHFGYMLSGSELLFSFIVGALIGLLLEGLWRMVKHRQS